MIRMVVKNATSEDFDIVEDKLNALIKKYEEEKENSKEDYAFHSSLYGITHNHAMECIESYMNKIFKRLWEYPLNMKKTFDKTIPLHIELFLALKNRSRTDAEKIYNEMMDMLVEEIKNA